jgi:hypothetical protein
MSTLANHPGFWLRDDAAQAFDRAEKDHGVFQVTSAGRTLAEEQALDARWLAGGAANRPPYLYMPAFPPENSNHVANGGIAVDLADWQRFLPVCADYGYTHPYGWDVVHFEYHGTASPAAFTSTPISTGTEDIVTQADLDQINQMIQRATRYRLYANATTKAIMAFNITSGDIMDLPDANPATIAGWQAMELVGHGENAVPVDQAQWDALRARAAIISAH